MKFHRGNVMDITERKITKIAREAEKPVLVSLRGDGCVGARLYLRYAGGAGCAVYQAVLCPPLCK